MNDNTFVIASDFVVQLTDAFKEEEKRPPALAEFCRLLQAGFERAEGVVEKPPLPLKIKAEVRKKKTIACKVGDLVAIPAQNREFFMALVLAKNQFGVALGFFQGTSIIRSISIHSHPPIEPHPIYTGEEFIETGRWRIIGHDDALLSLFPAEPEIYHYQYQDKPRPGIGPYGSGETISGRLRPLTKEEAEDLGLLTGTYRAVYLPDLLEEYLDRKS